MKDNPRLKRNINTAKATTGGGRTDNSEFPGDDGEYYFHFMGCRDFGTDPANTVLDFRACSTEEQADVAGVPMMVWISWEDSGSFTVEDKQEQLFEFLQAMGVDTPTLSEAQITAEIDAATKERRIVLCNVKSKGEYKNIFPKCIPDEQVVLLEDAEGGDSVSTGGGEDAGTSDLQVDDRVKVNFSGEFYEGVIKEETETGFGVLFDDGDTGDFAAELIVFVSREETDDDGTEEWKTPSECNELYCTYQETRLWITFPNDDNNTVDLANDDGDVVHEGVDFNDVYDTIEWQDGEVPDDEVPF